MASNSSKKVRLGNCSKLINWKYHTSYMKRCTAVGETFRTVDKTSVPTSVLELGTIDDKHSFRDNSPPLVTLDYLKENIYSPITAEEYARATCFTDLYFGLLIHLCIPMHTATKNKSFQNHLRYLVSLLTLNQLEKLKEGMS